MAETPMGFVKTRIETRDRQGRNSLAQLCRRFLMVLLSNPVSFLFSLTHSQFRKQIDG